MNENRECVEFSVTDYGKGIAKEEQRRIFEPFQQASTNEAQHGGTGLGLAITHKLVKVLGGKISVESEYGNYTTFRVVLPVKKRSASDEEEITDSEDTTPAAAAAASCVASEEKAASDEEEITDSEDTTPAAAAAALTEDSMSEGAPTEAPTKQRPMISPKLLALASSQQPAAKPDDDFLGYKVLIAEDNLVNQKVLTRTLQRLGITDIDVVENGQKAVDSWDKRDYKLIFMDLQMPVLDGIGATRIITQKKAEQGLVFPKVVFLTAHALQDYEDQAEEVGGDGFISKPFKLDIIKSMVQALVPGGGTGVVSADSDAVKVETPGGEASVVQGSSAKNLAGSLGEDDASRSSGGTGAVPADDGAVKVETPVGTASAVQGVNAKELQGMAGS
eukprot:CAMPEP_0171990380 /NCGR_PEP_ID=MMETSP0993-20121228/276893_1 /TAXON_ID=483369 /ORGANISM="non described non described, Strain CCMP2098" /LENGTH=389 /DNA_ID=CAMNT_0012643387 /DNA_START=30 /DNA_END=1200 /DNA_ORIENTATION=-